MPTRDKEKRRLANQRAYAKRKGGQSEEDQDKGRTEFNPWM
jgi:hypothetical protein